MLDYLSNIFNFANSKPIFPPRKSKIESINNDDISDIDENDLDEINASETSISDSTSELQTEAENYGINMSETSVSEDNDTQLVLDSEIETDMNNLLETDQLSETSYATITELSGGMKQTSFTDVKQEVKSYGSVLDEIIGDLDRMLKE